MISRQYNSLCGFTSIKRQKSNYIEIVHVTTDHLKIRFNIYTTMESEAK